MNRFEPSDNPIGLGVAWFVGFILVIAAVFVILALRGWALTYFWAWFITPYFNLPPLSIAQALGFCMVGGMVSSGLGRSSPKETKEWGWTPFISPFLVVGLGWIIKGFI